MNTLHLQKETEDLITIVNTEFNLDLQKKCRKRPYVDHATIIHYLKNINILFSHSPNLRDAYQRVSNLHSKGKDPINDMDIAELRNHIYNLRQNIESLSLRLTKTETRLDLSDMEGERLSDIFETIRRRLPAGKEGSLKSKLITVINGL